MPPVLRCMQAGSNVPAAPLVRRNSWLRHRGTLARQGWGSHAAVVTSDDTIPYTCPMHPEVRQQGPGSPRRRDGPERVHGPHGPYHRYLSDAPGDYARPARELSDLWYGTRTTDRASGRGSESRTGRHDPPVWISLLLTVPLLLLAMSEMLPGQPVQHAFSARLLTWVQLIFATPVVLWGWRRRAGGPPGQSQPEHVHTHRHWHWDCLHL